MLKIDKYKQYAPTILRIGISLVFLWFGITQLINPAAYLGYLPSFAQSIPLTSNTLIYINGIAELILGILLLIGLFTRLTAFIIILNLITIIIGLGYNDIAIRDFGLLLATLSVLLNGPDEYTLDFKRTYKP
tara:strand:- start:3164 stop:3559 length:396 start_codon:yes stop_codon:yes gene_type:complete